MRKLKIIGGKAEMVEKEKKPVIVSETVYNNIYLIDDPEPIKIPDYERFLYAICPECGKKFYIPDQKYCEKCGVEL